MPELPEVETTRRCLEPLLRGRAFGAIELRERRLREPVPADLPARLRGMPLRALERRAKYLLFRYAHGTMLMHLGMSGSLRIAARGEALRKHDHLRFGLAGGRELRYHDPRRFGLCLWLDGDPLQDARLANLGPEPLAAGFGGATLLRAFRSRRAAVKPTLMDPGVVVGVGNIYASEALHRAGIRPGRAAGRVGAVECERLAASVRAVLREALCVGGTTLRDYVSGSGNPGAFAVRLRVYGREGEPCPRCRKPIRRGVHGQRASFWCSACQA